MKRTALLLLTMLAAGCGSEAVTPEVKTPPPSKRADLPGGHRVRFVEDDFAGAMATAQKEGKLVFVDAWAPWCHTCLSMRDVVFSRAELGRFERDFVFVAVDTDRPSSEAFAERYRMRVWPTMFVVDPATRGVLAMYGGSMSFEELARMLEGAVLARKGGQAPGQKELVLAHAAYGEKKLAQAARLYEDAATRLPDAQRGVALVAAIRALYEAEDIEACTTFGREHADAVKGSSSPSDFLVYLKECTSKTTDAEKKREGIAFVRKRLEKLVASPAEDATVDDRADTMGALAEILRDQKEVKEARALEEKRLAILETAAKAAPSPERAQTYDYQRMLAYLALGLGDDAVRMLEERARQLPQSYEAFARLGSTYLELKRPVPAVIALDRAIELAYGPRRLLYMGKKAKALTARGDPDGAIATLEAEVKGWQELPASQQDAKKLADAQSRLDAARAQKPKPK